MLCLDVGRAAGSTGLRHNVCEISKIPNSLGLGTGLAALNLASFAILLSSYRCFPKVEVLLNSRLHFRKPWVCPIVVRLVNSNAFRPTPK